MHRSKLKKKYIRDSDTPLISQNFIWYINKLVIMIYRIFAIESHSTKFHKCVHSYHYGIHYLQYYYSSIISYNNYKKKSSNLVDFKHKEMWICKRKQEDTLSTKKAIKKKKYRKKTHSRPRKRSRKNDRKHALDQEKRKTFFLFSYFLGFFYIFRRFQTSWGGNL